MRTMVMLLSLAAAACGKSAEDYAGSYNGDEVFKFVVAGETQESKETTTEKFTAVNDETLRLDSDCPVEFKMTGDTSFAVVPRSCSATEDGVQLQLTVKTGAINFTDAAMALSFGGDVTANSVTGTFDVTFNGKKQ